MWNLSGRKVINIPTDYIWTAIYNYRKSEDGLDNV